MKPRRSRLVILLLLGISISIVPVRAHYALTTRGTSTGHSSSLLPRAQQRIRLVSMRAVSLKSARDYSQGTTEGQPHVSLHMPVPISLGLAPAYPICGHATLNCLVHPLRC